MAKKILYAVAVLDGNKLYYVTGLGAHHMAYWDDDTKAMYFNREMAEEIVLGLSWNGFSAYAILKPNWKEYGNGAYIKY